METPQLQSAAERRRYLMALMIVSGLTKVEVARRLGYSRQHITRVTNSPDFIEYVGELQREMRENSLGSLIDRIEREAQPSLDTVVNIRDGQFDEPGVGRVQLDAAKFILGDLHMDRRYPKVTKQENDGILHVSFGAEAVRQMLGAQAEAQNRPIDVEFTEATAQVALPAPSHRTDLNDDVKPKGRKPRRVIPLKPIVAQHINEVLDELEDDEETARKTGTGEY